MLCMGVIEGLEERWDFFSIVIVGFLMICIGFTGFFVMYIDDFGFFLVWFLCTPPLYCRLESCDLYD